MKLVDTLTDRGRSGAVRLGLLGLMSTTVLLGGCMRQPETGPSKEQIWRQVYASRLENLQALDRAFNELGQEYYKLEIEYKSAGRDDLAQISRDRAEAFHEQHLMFQERIAELEEIDGRLRRGESALEIQAQRQSESQEPARYTEPTARPSRPQPASSSQNRRAPSGSDSARPSRTPTPSRTGLGGASGSSSSSRFNDPIIITDPKLNNR